MDLVPKAQLMYYIDPGGWEVVASSCPVHCPPHPAPPHPFSAFRFFPSFVKLKDFLLLLLFLLFFFLLMVVVVFGEYSGQQKTLWSNQQKPPPTVDFTASGFCDFPQRFEIEIPILSKGIMI